MTASHHQFPLKHEQVCAIISVPSQIQSVASALKVLAAQQQRARADEKEDYFIKTRIKCNLPRAPWRIANIRQPGGRITISHCLLVTFSISYSPSSFVMCSTGCQLPRIDNALTRGGEKKLMHVRRRINGPPLKAICVC